MRVSPWYFAIVAGACISVTIALIVVAWEWLENPGEIYRDASGTHWGTVSETAISWLVPAFACTTILALLLYWALSALRRRR